MKKQVLAAILILAVSITTIAQQNQQLEHFLEEKVRDPLHREYVEKLLNGTATEADFKFLKERWDNERMRQNSQRSNYEFTGGAEPHIAINPGNTNEIAISYMESGITAEYPIYYSDDGGTTWSRSAYSTTGALSDSFPNSFIVGGGDPIVAFDDDGTLHLSYIYLHGDFIQQRADMFYAFSTDGGATFTVPADLEEDHVVYSGNIFLQDMLDRQWMAVDNSGGPYDGNLYLSSVYFGGALGGAGEVVITKPAGASGFDEQNTVLAVNPGNDATQFGNIKVDDNGAVHLSCIRMDNQTGFGDILHTKSVDGGNTFSTPKVAGTGTTKFPNGGSPTLIHNRENTATSMAVDGNNVYLVWLDQADNDAHSFFSYSNDGGGTFSTQWEFGNDLIDSNSYHFMPNVSADSGKVAISWYVVDKTTLISNYYLAVSEDSGATFDSLMMISTDSMNFGTAGTSDFYGDYNASENVGCLTYSVWADGRSGAPMVYIAKTNLCRKVEPAVGVPEISPLTEAFSVISVYPNPATDNATIRVKLQRQEKITIDITDVNGRVIRQAWSGQLTNGNNDVSIDVNDLATGTYLLNVQRSNGQYATRILVKQ